MQAPIEVTFQGMESVPQLQDLAAKQADEIAKQFTRMTACRIVVKAPVGHRHTNGLFDVHIRMTFADEREVNVDRTEEADERYSDPVFAINQAFNRARRQLRDHARHPNGTV